MPMKTSELSGAALDWAVAKCEGYTCLHKIEGRMPHEPQLVMWPPRKAYGLVDLWELGYSTDWSLAGPIIDREDIAMSSKPDGLWSAYAPKGTRLVQHGGRAVEVFNWTFKQEGYTPLIAAMRCYVASKLGDDVDVPEELT